MNRAARIDRSCALPNYEDYEQNILGCILIDGLLIEKVSSKLSPEGFYFTKHQPIYECMLDISKKGVPIDLLTVSNALMENGQYENAGATSYLTLLTEVAIGDANIDYHIKKVKEAAYLRLIWEKSQLLSQAIQSGDDLENIQKLHYQLSDLSDDKYLRTEEVISLSDYNPTQMVWLLKDAIPCGFPTIIYGEGGLGKSYLALFIAVKACIGGQRFLGLEFPEAPQNVLIVDYELNKNEQKRRADKISRGLGLSGVPKNLTYYAPEKSLSKEIQKLRHLIKVNKINLLVIDSLGASSVDGESVPDVVSLFTELRKFGIAVLILDHQSKQQQNDNYNQKTPFGSVYKYNLARSVFQLSKVNKDGNPVSLKLIHKKSNFERLLGDLLLDVIFKEDAVLFLESHAQSPEMKENELIHKAIQELSESGKKVNQKTIIKYLEGTIGRDRLISLLEKGEGKLWETEPGNRKEKLYKIKTLKNGNIYNQGFSVLDSNSIEFDIPEVLND